MSSNVQQPIWATDLQPPRWLWLLIIILPIAAIIAFVGYQSTQVLPRLALAPAYSLVDQEGNQLTNESLRGNLVLYSFIHAQCTAPCVDSSHTLQALQQTLNEQEPSDIPLHFVTISTDSQHDTPQSLRAYAQTLGADAQQWHFVSANPEQFSNLIQATSQEETRAATVSPQEDTMANTFALVDGWGIVRAIYQGNPPDLPQIQHDLRLVAQEARNSTGVNRYAYKTVHLFMCHNDLTSNFNDNSSGNFSGQP